MKVNYILSGEQKEAVIYADIRKGQHRSVFVPKDTTFLRVRLGQKDILHHQPSIDEQTDDLNDINSLCYLLLHKNSHSAYSRCPVSYRDMLEVWKNVE